MTRKIIRGRLAEGYVPIEQPVEPFLDRLLAGETHSPEGLPIGMGVDWSKVPPETVEKLLASRAPASTGRTRI